MAKKKVLKKVGKGIKKTAKKIGKGIKKTAKKVGKAVKKTVGSVATAPLLPFKAGMIAILKSKGISTSGLSFPKIIELFYNNVISKKAKKTSKFDAIDDDRFAESYLFKTDYDSFDESSDNIEFMFVAGVVQEIVNYFKEAKKKKLAAKNKKELTKEEQIAASTTEQVQKKLEEKMNEEAAVKHSDINKYLILVVFAIIIIFLFKK